MTSRVQTNRSTATGSRPPSTRPVGEFYVNFADNQIGVVDATPAARDLLPIRFHSPTANYLANDLVQQAGGIYQARAAIPAHAFNANEWNQFLTGAQGDTRWLPLTGGTLVGPLTLSGPPVNNLHATTKTYVDTAVATKLNLAGGTLTGPLILAGDPTVPLGASTKQYADTKLPLAGGTLTGALTLSGAPTVNLHAATKLYVDTADATKVPLAGGTMTGLLTLSGAPTSALHAATKAYVDAVSTSLGNYLPLAGGTVTGAIIATSFTVSGSGAYLFGDANYSGMGMDPAGWQWRYTRATGRLGYYRGSDGTELFAIDPSGGVGVVGALTAASITAQTLHATQDVIVDRNISAAGGIGAANVDTSGFVRAATTLFASGSNIALGPGGSGRIMQMQPGYYFDFNTGNGDMVWFGNSTAQWYMRAFDGTCFNSVSYVGGHGAYHDLSDERLKTDITPATVGLPEILAIEPINFHRLGADGQPYTRDEIGFSAQQVQPIIPEAVTEAGIGLPDGLALAAEMILAAAVNAIKTLNQRVSVLETL